MDKKSSSRKKKQKLNEVVVLPVLLFHDVLNILEKYQNGSEGPVQPL